MGVEEFDYDLMDNDFYLLAKTYFDCKEYRRAAHVLRDQTSKIPMFLRFYSLYLVGFFYIILNYIAVLLMDLWFFYVLLHCFGLLCV